MRHHYLRFDIWLCLALSFLFSLIPVKIVEKNIFKWYESYVEEHAVADGEIGGIASESIYRAENIEDLLSHENFTVISWGIEYCNRGAGYHAGYYMYALTLPSGERVAAIINNDSIQHMGETIYDGDTILPVGHIIYDDLTEDEYFLNQIEHSAQLSRTDFYVDMLGEGGKVSQENYTKKYTTIIQLLAIAIAFPIFHIIGVKLGLFSSFFPPKNRNITKWK